MPDLRTALATALIKSKEKQMNTQVNELIKQWNDEPIANPFKHGRITSNTSRATFNAIRDNPHRTTKELRDILHTQGYNEASVSTLVTQMVRCGMIMRTANGAIYTSLKEYRPIKKVNKPVKRKPQKKAPTQNVASGIAAIPRSIPLAPVTPTVSNTLNIDALLATITLKEAVLLVAALQNMLKTLRMD